MHLVEGFHVSCLIYIRKAVSKQDDIESGFFQVLASVADTILCGDAAYEDILRLQH